MFEYLVLALILVDLQIGKRSFNPSRLIRLTVLINLFHILQLRQKIHNLKEVLFNMCINVHKMSILFLYFVLGLVTFDSLHIVFAILDSIRTSFRKLYPNFLMMIFPWFHFPLLRITLVGSIYMVISVSVERYLAVCFPHNYHRMNSQAFRFLYYIIPAAAAAIFVNVPKFFETQNDYR